MLPAPSGQEEEQERTWYAYIYTDLDRFGMIWLPFVFNSLQRFPPPLLYTFVFYYFHLFSLIFYYLRVMLRNLRGPLGSYGVLGESCSVRIITIASRGPTVKKVGQEAKTSQPRRPLQAFSVARYCVAG